VRRGLMKWDPQELPLDCFEDRIGRLRAQMTNTGLDGFIIYTNNVRPSAVHYLTGFTPYWSEGLLLAPKSGRLLFATALSNRVAEWIRSTNPVSEVISTPRPGMLIAERIAKQAAVQRIGILELDGMPSELFDDLAAAAPTVAWVDGSTQFAAARSGPDALERALLQRADALALAALDEASGAHRVEAGALAGSIEKQIRLAGAEEVYVAMAPDLAADRRLSRIAQSTSLADRFAVRASVSYKGSWIRRTRTYISNRSAIDADAWFKELIGGMQVGQSLTQQISTHLAALRGARLESWTAESCIGSYPLSPIGSSRSPEHDVAAGRFLVLTIALLLEQGPWIGAAPFIASGPSETP
jgi:Creatinase/Prolidase N-terminal domain